jgi:hypothetical protein
VSNPSITYTSADKDFVESVSHTQGATDTSFETMAKFLRPGPSLTPRCVQFVTSVSLLIDCSTIGTST